MDHAALRQIKASAGSGKTYALTGDFLRLLADAADEPRPGCRMARPGAHAWPEILAVTFTNRAATEMKERVLARIKDMALGVIPPEEGWDAAGADRAVDGLLRDFGSLNIRTIDSLLHLIVRLAALDLDLAPDFEPCFDDNELFAPLLDDLAERAREGDPDLTDAFAGACRQILLYGDYRGFLAGDRVRARIAELASYLLRHQDNPLLDRLAPPERIAARLGRLRGNLRERARALAVALDAAGLAVHANLRKALDKCADPACPDSALPSDSKMLAKDSLDECLNKASKGQADAACENLYARLRDAAAALEGEGAVLRGALGLMPFTRLARRLLEELGDFQRDAGKVPASRVPALAGRALSGEYGVNEAFCRMGSRLTHILVDEFQDTSVDQWLALKPLVVEALAREGSLTIVGDVKQAIYGWRGGEAALFDLVPEDPALRSMAPRPEFRALDRNWRSREDVVAWNNAVFSQLGDEGRAREILALMLPADTDETLVDEAAALLATAFTDATQRPVPGKSGGVVRLRALPAPVAPAAGDDGVAALLPQRVAELGERYAWGDICVLTRTNPQTSLAASLLLERGIPVVTQGSLLLAEQPLIMQLVALLAFLNAPEDDNAFWIVLAGADLLPAPADLAASGGPAAASSHTVLPALDATALNDWAARRAGRGRRSLARSFRLEFPRHWDLLFAPLHDAAGLLTPYDLVCEIYRRWRVPARHPDADGFLRRFLEVLHTAEQRGLCDLAGFLDYWKTHGGEEKAPLPETMDAVTIMTIHKAKGLQFEAVVAPWHDFPIRAGDEPTPCETEGLAALAPLCSAMGEPYAQALADTAREALHLLYVAWTRAVSELHCFLPSEGKGRMAAALASLLAPLLDGAARTEDGDWVFGALPVLSSPAGEQIPAASQTADADATAPAGPHGTGEDSGDDGEAEGPDTQWDEPETWRPMAWLPRLKIFRTPLQDWLGDDAGGRSVTAKRRGTLMHHCLERLRVTGHTAASARADAVQAVRHGLRTFPLPVPEPEATARDLTEALAWYAALPETGRHLAFGTPEHALLDAEGRAHRVDLLVDDGRELVAVEYKTGTSGALPDPEHVGQLRGYLDLLRAASGRPVRGELVYLDRRERFGLDGAGERPLKAAS